VVPQKALLFSGTIAENLRWGKDGATDEEIARAAKLSCADAFVRAFPDGYETALGQAGVNLSGGQKQRLSIARALIREPKILILDDCTSALDAFTEAAVLKGLRSEAGRMTVLIISQRVSTVMRADRILCLEDGSLRGFGTHAELMESCDTYRAIYSSQIGGELIG
jgi:ATP-binding cassette subfamily B protein